MQAYKEQSIELRKSNFAPDTLTLPFFDDFSSSSGFPDTSKWLYGSVGGTYINNRFCVDPPTLNVATFDGLKADGTPYNFTDPLAEGKADSLVSWPIDLRNNFLNPIGMIVDSTNIKSLVDTTADSIVSVLQSIDTVCSDTTFPVCPVIFIISIDSSYDTTYAYSYDTTWIFSYFSFFWQAGGVDANLNPDPSDSIWFFG